jgi:hypothetical protein
MRINWGYWNDFCDRLAVGEITGSHHFRPIGQPCLSVHVRQGRLAKPTFATLLRSEPARPAWPYNSPPGYRSSPRPFHRRAATQVPQRAFCTTKQGRPEQRPGRAVRVTRVLPAPRRGFRERTSRINWIAKNAVRRAPAHPRAAHLRLRFSIPGIGASVNDTFAQGRAGQCRLSIRSDEKNRTQSAIDRDEPPAGFRPIHLYGKAR